MNEYICFFNYYDDATGETLVKQTPVTWGIRDLSHGLWIDKSFTHTYMADYVWIPPSQIIKLVKQQKV